MSEQMTMRPIARIHTDFPTKFGIPRQSGLADELTATVVFEPEYRDINAVRGLEDFSHIWLIWWFSENTRTGWSPTVRPPRLGGNERVGVFATRSPYRPNALGLSCVRLEAVRLNVPDAPILYVRGADLMDGTPILDVKPYLPYTDCVQDTRGGFAPNAPGHTLTVDFSEELKALVPAEKVPALIQILEGDPRPAYQNDPERYYGVAFAGLDVRFTVSNHVLHVKEIVKR